jgi:oligogalacturonide transport system substrate-binding protein
MLLVCVTVLSVFAACGSAPAADAPAADAPAADAPAADAPAADAAASEEPVTLRFMWWGDDIRAEATVAAINLYQEQNPGVTITAENTAWDGYREKLVTMFVGGTAPDLIQCSYSWGREFQQQGSFFADIASYDIVDLTQFDENFLREYYCYYNDELIGLPSGVAPFSFTVNTDLLTQAGFDYNVEWTWDTVLEAGRAMQAMDSESYLLEPISLTHSFQFWFMPWIVGMTGKQAISDDFELGFTREDALAFANYFQQVKDEKIAQPASEGIGLTSQLENPTWMAGKIAAMYEYSSTIMQDEFTQTWIDVAENVVVPHNPEWPDKGIQALPAQLFCVPASGQVVPAIEFLNFLLTDAEAAKVLKDVRSVPASKTALEVCAAEGLINPLVTDATTKGMENAGMAYNQNSFYAGFEDVVNAAFEKMLLSDATPEEVVDEIFTLMPPLLEEMKATAEAAE